MDSPEKAFKHVILTARYDTHFNNSVLGTSVDDSDMLKLT
jgi:hypothetical protein